MRDCRYHENDACRNGKDCQPFCFSEDPHTDRTQVHIMRIFRTRPNEWLTSGEIASEIRNTTPTEVAGNIRILASTDTRIETVITPSHRRRYRFNEVQA